MNKNIEYNEKISSDRLKIISVEGHLIGEMTKKEALKIAYEKEMDLVVCAPTATPPVAKICYLDKYLFELNKKEKQMKKTTKQVELKKIKIGINIDQNDLKTKIKHAREFFDEGNSVMFFTKLRKKEMPKSSNGILSLKKIAESLSDVAAPLKEPALDRNTISLTLKAVSKKK